MRCALLSCILLIIVVFNPSAEALSSLSINEVLAAPGSDWNGDLEFDSRGDEWVEIVNCGSETINLGNYLLLNGYTRQVVHGFTQSLEPGDYLVISGEDALEWQRSTGASLIGLSLNNGGDVVYLAKIMGGDTLIIDSLSYTASQVGYDVSLARVPDGYGEWCLFDHLQPLGGSYLDPTPGFSNSSDPPPHIIEVLRTPLYPRSCDSVTISVTVGDASGVTTVLLAYDINLEDGEEPEMLLTSGTEDLGTWVYTIPPSAPGDTVHYRVSAYDEFSVTRTPWMGYRVRGSVTGVVINEILADPPTGIEGDANKDGTRDASDDEFIEILNCGNEEVDISGWKIKDGIGVRHIFDSGTVLSPGEFVTVFGGGVPFGFTGKVFIASSGGLSLSNTGDVVSLVDSHGNLVDYHSYGSEGARDQSMIRFPDCNGEWTTPEEVGISLRFSPQAPNNSESAVAPSTWGAIKALFR